MPKFYIELVKKVSFIFIFTLFACEEDTKKGPTPDKPLRIANGAEPQSIDPHRCTGVPGIRIIGALFEGLVTRNPKTGGVDPGIAKSWSVSEDGKTYTFNLRKSNWSNGAPLIAGDFVYSWRRLLNPKTGAEYASLLDILQNGKKILSGELPPDSLGVEAKNDSTFTAKLTNPTGYFLSLCSFEPLFPVPQQAVEKHGDQWTQVGQIISNGPFMLKEWIPYKNMNLSKSTSYWDVKNVKEKELNFFPIEDSETAYKMYLNKELDWILSIPLSKINAAKKRKDYVNTTSYGVYYYSLNMTKKELQNVNLRKALAYAIDRQKIVEFVTKGGEKPATGFVPIIDNIPYKGTQLNMYNSSLAKEYYKKAGFGKDNPAPELTLLYNTSENHKRIAEVVAQMWKQELGFTVKLHNMEWKIYLQETKNKKHQIARASWMADYQDPYSFLELGVSTAGNNRSGYNSGPFDKCIASTQNIQDRSTRLNKLAECEKIMMEDMPLIPVYFYAINELRNPKLAGADLNPMGIYPWKNIELN